MRIETGGHRDLQDAALRIVVGVSLGADNRFIAALAGALARRQTKAGTWPVHAAFQAFNHWGAEALTTAICVRALFEAGRYSRKPLLGSL